MDLMDIIEIKNLCKEYKGKEEPALKNINISIKEVKR
jgi:ABC-2 type transport system ATP-binding protein